MPWGQALRQAFSLSITGDGALLDTRRGRAAAAHRACPRQSQYSLAAPARRCGGRCQRLPTICVVAYRLAREPRYIRAGRNLARLAADRPICPAPARPDLGARQFGPLLDDAANHHARSPPGANRAIPLSTTPELFAGHS